MEAANIEERIRWTEERLRKVLRSAKRTRYGKRISGGPGIGDWPILNKDQVRNHEADFMTVGAWRTSHAATSGTTGTPLQLYRSLSSVSVEQAAIDRLLIKKGVDPRNYRAAVLRGDDIKDPNDLQPPFWINTNGGKRLVFSSNHLNRETVSCFVEEIKRFEPQVLHAYPTILDSLCNLLLESHDRPVIPITICSSEVLPSESWSRCKLALESEVIDYYGQAERASFAYAFEPSQYRFLPGYSYNELIPVDDDDRTYELVCTGLWNLAMPLVRFRTGDLVRFDGETDLGRIAYGVDTFPGVIGRSGDFLIAPDGTKLMGIDHIPRGIRNVVRMQVIQESPEFVRILVVPEPSFADSDKAAIDANVRKKLPPSMRWQIALVPDLERNQAGKAPYVIRR